MGTDYMTEAIAEARKAFDMGEVPVGAVIVDVSTGDIIARSKNGTEGACDPTAHAEMLVIREACSIKKSPRLPDCDLYVTLEPCPMCAAAISAARIRRLYFGAYDPKSGGIEQGACVFSHATCHHKPEIYGGINEVECGEMMTDFFKGLRDGF